MARQFAIDQAWVAEWCADALRSRPRRQLFETGYLSHVTGIELDDGHRVVVKVRPWADRLLGCAEVHAALFRAGYPCPQPLTDTEHVDTWAVSAEALVAEHERLSLGPDSAALFADALYRLIAAAPSASTLPTLRPTPPWADWQGIGRAALWPAPDDRSVDLNAVDRTWIDAVAATARRFLLDHCAEPVVGHVDWYGANLGWRDRRLVAVFDWDSIAAQPEPAIAGCAAAVWRASGRPGDEATVGQSDDFLRHYSATRDWSHDDVRSAWAAGLWVRCFDAKKAQASGDDPDVVITQVEAEQRLARAGL